MSRKYNPQMTTTSNENRNGNELKRVIIFIQQNSGGHWAVKNKGEMDNRHTITFELSFLLFLQL